MQKKKQPLAERCCMDPLSAPSHGSGVLTIPPLQLTGCRTLSQRCASFGRRTHGSSLGPSPGEQNDVTFLDDVELTCSFFCYMCP